MSTGEDREGRQGEPTLRTSLEDLAAHTDPGLAQPNPGHQLFTTWFQLFRTAQIHALDNQATERAVRRFTEAVARVVGREGHVSLQARDQTLFVNRVKLKLSSEEFALAAELFSFFRERGMGGFAIEGRLDAGGVRRLLEILVYAPPAERSFDRLRLQLEQSGLPVSINRTLGARKRDGGAPLERRLYTFATYSKLVVLYRSLLADDGRQEIRRRFLMRKTRRIMQALVDICLEDDHTFLGLCTVKEATAYGPQHAANTAVLAIALGEKVGLGKVELADLGLAALFHDIGMPAAAAELMEKPGPLSGAERERLESHPLRGVEQLLAEPSFGKSLLRRIVVTFEHHCGLDGSGYPKLSRRPHLFSRIVAIAAAYDALTTARPWRKAFLPDEALSIMLAEAGKVFDEALLKVFVNSLGLYPVGTLVRLSGGELAVVAYSGNEGERAVRPMVALLGNDGRPRGLLDLAERGPDGSYRRSIVSSEDPHRYGLRPAGVLAISPG